MHGAGRCRGLTVLRSWCYAVQAIWCGTPLLLYIPAESLKNVIVLAICFTVQLLLGLATYALIIGPEFPEASRLAVDKESVASRLWLAGLCLLIGLLKCSTWATSADMTELGIVFLGQACLVALSIPFISSATLWFDILIVRDEGSHSAEWAAMRLYERTMELFQGTVLITGLGAALLLLLLAQY